MRITQFKSTKYYMTESPFGDKNIVQPMHENDELEARNYKKRRFDRLTLELDLNPLTAKRKIDLLKGLGYSDEELRIAKDRLFLRQLDISLTQFKLRYEFDYCETIRTQLLQARNAYNSELISQQSKYGPELRIDNLQNSTIPILGFQVYKK